MPHKQAFLDIINVLATPTEVFAHLRQNPRWDVAFLSICIASLVIQWFMIPLIEQPFRHIYDNSFGEGAGDAIISSMTKFFLFIGFGVELGFMLLRWIIFATLFYSLSLTLDIQVRLSFKTMFAIVVYCEIIFTLMAILNLLILYAKGIDQIQEPVDLRAIVGLDFFMKDSNSNPPLFTLLSSVNIFSVWYVATLGLGFSIATGLKKLEAIFLTAFVWLIWCVVQMAGPLIEKVAWQMTI